MALFANEYKETVEAAWSAIGVGEDSGGRDGGSGGGGSVLDLKSDVPVTGQSASTGDITYYQLKDVSVYDSVNCTLLCDNGDADLYMRWVLVVAFICSSAWSHVSFVLVLPQVWRLS